MSEQREPVFTTDSGMDDVRLAGAGSEDAFDVTAESNGHAHVHESDQP